MLRGIYPGRFQPFHLGHLEVVKWALDKVDELIIAVGSAQESHTLANPFTAGERIEMIRGSLEEAGLYHSRVMIIPIPDILMNSVWVHHVIMYMPKFNVVISRNPLVVRLFKEVGIEPLKPPMFNREKYNSTNIRLQIISKDNAWTEAVPPFVAKHIREIRGEERLREIAGTDKAESTVVGKS